MPDTHRKGVEEHRGISRGKILGTGGSGSGELKPSSSSGAPIQPAGDITGKPTVTVRGDTTEILPTYGSKVLPSAAVSVPSTEHQQNIFSNSSSITNSLASSRSPSAVVLTTLESKIDSPDSGTTKPKLIVQNVEEENKVMSLNCYSPRDGSSCDGSETAASPLSIPAPIPSPPGTAVRRRIHDATAAAATAAAAAEGQSSGGKVAEGQSSGGKVAEGQSSGGKVADAQFSGGKVTQVARRTPTPAEKKAAQEKLQFEEEIAKVEMSHIYGKREEVMKQIGSRKNSATEEMMPTNIVASPARDSSKEVKIQEPLPSPSVTTKGPNQEKSSSPLSDDEEDFSLGEPDDDEENSMSASSDLDIYNGRRLVMGSANKTPLPHGRGSTSEVFGNSQSAEDVEALADMSSSFETSQSAGKTSGSLRAHLSAHFDPLDRSGESGSGTHTPDSRERRTSLVPLAPIPRTLSPSTSTPSIPNVTGVVSVKGSAIKSASASAPDDISNSASAPLPFTSMPLYGSITVPATVPGRSPQPVLSGSLLSTGRRSAAPLVHKPAPPKISSEPGSKLQAGAGSGKLGSNQTKSKDLDDDGNLDFDSSSWDEDDDAEISG